jgi:hypothetical protein
MINFRHILLLLLFTITIFSCSSPEKQSEVNTNPIVTTKTEIWLFHQTRRCKSCKAVEAIAESVLRNEFLDIKDSVQLRKINLSLPENNQYAEKFKANWSGLYLCTQTSKGEIIENLTTFALFYAQIKPDTVYSLLKQKINQNLRL